MTIVEPRDIHELRSMLSWSAGFAYPCAIRYVKEGIDLSEIAPFHGFTLGCWEQLRSGKHFTLIAHGRMVSHALQAAQLLAQQDVQCGVINASTIKPLDENTLQELLAQNARLVVIEETVPSCSR